MFGGFAFGLPKSFDTRVKALKITYSYDGNGYSHGIGLSNNCESHDSQAYPLLSSTGSYSGGKWCDPAGAADHKTVVLEVPEDNVYNYCQIYVSYGGVFTLHSVEYMY